MSLARVSAIEVKEVIGTNIVDSTIQGSFIDTAHVFVDTHLLSAGHSEEMLTKIELYLAAHFVALTEERGGLTGEKVGDASEFFSNVYKAGFNATRYGQIALTLDTSGILASKGTTGAKAEFRVI